jgi:hypothetical protein
VEHTVTEQITGFYIAKSQILIRLLRLLEMSILAAVMVACYVTCYTS